MLTTTGDSYTITSSQELHACYCDKLGISLSSSQITLGWTTVVWSWHMEVDWLLLPMCLQPVLCVCVWGLPTSCLELFTLDLDKLQWWPARDVYILSPGEWVMSSSYGEKETQMPRVSCDKADWNDVITSQGKSRTVWHSPETRRGQESSPAGSSGATVTYWF